MNDEYEKIPKSQTVRGPDLLKMLPPQTKIFDNLSPSGSQISEISIPFSDPVYTVEVVSKNKAKELYGKDLYTAIDFSSEFKTAMEEVKKDIALENPDPSIAAENLEEIKSRKLFLPGSSGEESPGITEPKFLQIPDTDFEFETKEESEIEDKKKEEKVKKKKTAKILPDDEETLFDTMSGYWRMLSVFDEFKISPPCYNAYAEGQEHWLQTERIPEEVLENSKSKCLSWLKKYFDN